MNSKRRYHLLLLIKCFILLMLGCRGGGFIKESKDLDFGLTSAPDPPIEVSVKNIGFRSATISWTGSSSYGFTVKGYSARLEKYELQYAKSLTFEDVIILETAQTSRRIEGLDRGTAYFVRVRAVNENETRRASRYVMLSSPKLGKFTTNQIDPRAFRVDPPSDLSVFYDREDATKVTIVWVIPHNKGIDKDGNPADILNYYVEYSKDLNFNILDGEPLNASNPKIEITKLEPKTTYYLRVKATNSLGEASKYSTVKLFTSKDYSSAPLAKVSSLKFKVESSKITTTWERPSKTLDYGRLSSGSRASLSGYFIEVSSSENFTNGTQTTINNSFVASYEFRRDPQIKIYYVRIKVVNTANIRSTNSFKMSFDTG